MKTLSKALIGTVAAGAMATSSVSPAAARDHRDNGISAGDVIAGALIIGGIAAVASASSNNRDYDRDYRDGRDYRGEDYRYDRAGYGRDREYDRGQYGGNPRQAIEQCVRAAERYAGQRSYGGRADVTDVRDIDRTHWGYEVRGRIAVNTQGRNWRQGDSRYGQGWGGDYRGYNDGNRGYDSGSFKCKIERGRIVDLDVNGIRGL